MEWPANRGLSSLLRRTVVVLNDSDGNAISGGLAPSWLSNSAAGISSSLRFRSMSTCDRAE
jgi:hypothetical protein